VLSEWARLFALVNLRWLFVGSALFLLLLVNSALAGGAYQRTKDRKTKVWNNSPQPGDVATWSGERDTDGYATGSGTLTWSIVTSRKLVTGSHLPSAAHSIVLRYSGNMVQGKLDGPVVNVDENGATFHGKFANGRRVGDWATGPAPSSSRASKADEHHNAPDQRNLGTTNAEPPAEKKPVEAPKATPAPAQPVEQPVSKGAVKGTPSQDVDDSLRALVGPPPLLRTEPTASPSSSPHPSPGH
jgi:hypothetical protein